MLQLEGLLGPSEILRFIEEKLGVGVWLCDAAGRAQWSRGLYELLGLDPHEVTPSYEELIRRIHPDDLRQRHDLGGRVLDQSLLEGEFRIIRPNRAQRWVYNQAETLLDAAGEPACVLGVTLDITEQRKAMRPLKLDAERYSALTQVAGGLPWIGSFDGRIVALLNEERVPSAHAFLGRGWVDLLHEEERDAALKNWAASAETGRPYRVEQRLRQTDGTYRWFRCMAVPVANPDGGIREWLGNFIDVHNEKLISDQASASKLTGAQIRAARGMLNWSVKDLAGRTGVSAAVIRRLEEYNDTPPMSDELMNSLRNTFSDAGIEFLLSPNGKPGVRPR
ncbi:PAS domain-containing protein [Bradyrhizobium sp. 187]|uniref:PAS domain-containing protein n=1 Tax=Bradyrhizobium sp. 187 TaxID=2782655 RepID=UPI001FFFEEE0|nr:PAS domain-containing protein [Bradyrhizobium sp. 187]UPJ71842.1 PAS domain-containing protein [Bradyrhizobium sp. 187]